MNQQIRQIIFDNFGIEASVVLTRPEPEFGDYATNVAMQLAKSLGKNPREIAEVIASELRQVDGVREVNVAGPGFINLLLSDSSLLDLTRRLPENFRQGQNITIETNNPNPFKAMHIGHAFNSILGDTIANLLAVSGATVHRASYHGDVGLHVGRSMFSLLKFADGDFSKIANIDEPKRNSFMSKAYSDGSLAYKEDENAKNEIDRLAQLSFEPSDDLYGQIYKLCKKWSFEQIDNIVKRIGNVPIEKRFLESEADARGVEIVHSNTPKVFEESDGAFIFRGSKYGSFDNVFVSSKGRGLYGARDLGLIQLKDEAFGSDFSYIVTAEEQRDYFKGVIAAANLVWPDKKDTTINISTGTVRLSTGKMSSRDGDVVEIAWLFDQFADAIRERGGQPNDAVVAGALRYQFLKVKIGSDVVFDVNEAVGLVGNTGSYLQYAHARARQVLKKSSASFVMPTEVLDEDRGLVRKLGEYHEAVNTATSQLEPHHICNYLFELAQEFNRYYEKNRVVGSELEIHRAGLVALYADTLKAGLAILGIDAPEEL